MNTQLTASATDKNSSPGKGAGFLARCRLMSVALLSLTLAAPALAGNIQSLDSIREAVHAFVAEQHLELGGETELEIGRIDPRLRLAACEQPLSTFSPHAQRSAGNLTVGVRCEGARPWTLYVPVRVNSFVEVLVLASSVNRGTVLSPEDLRPTRRNLASLPHGFFTDPNEVIGLETRRPLRAGEILAPNALTEPRMISRGQEVWLEVEAGGISVSAKAEALRDGARGERIQVRNLSSGRIVEAEVVDPGRVRASL